MVPADNHSADMLLCMCTDYKERASSFENQILFRTADKYKTYFAFFAQKPFLLIMINTHSLHKYFPAAYMRMNLESPTNKRLN